jgi:hypothetical protein
MHYISLKQIHCAMRVEFAAVEEKLICYLKRLSISMVFVIMLFLQLRLNCHVLTHCENKL